MSVEIIFQQMTMICIMVLIGYFLYNISDLDEHSSKHISSLVSNVCNPAVLIYAALTNTMEIGKEEFLSGMLLSMTLYVVLIAISFVVPHLLRVERKSKFAYQMMVVYANTGFIGIPLVSAVLPDALFYVTLNNISYSIFFYTHGVYMIKKVAMEQRGEAESDTSLAKSLKSVINIGTVTSILALFLYLFPIHMPTVISDTLNYAGRSTTFLSMLVIGVSLGQMGLKNLFVCKKVLYVFIAIRLIVIPIVLIFIIKMLIDDELLVGATSFMLSVPAGNLPLMVAQQNDVKTDTLARGIILSTIFSIVTIPIVMLFV